MDAPLKDQDERGRLAKDLLPGGSEPDPRFSLANERTFLAWIRTSLALLAGGIAVETFTVEILSSDMRRFVALLLMLLAFFISAPAFYRWLSIERAMRLKQALPFSVFLPLVCFGVTLAIACFAIVMAFNAGH